MGQKTNPNILLIKQTNKWHSKWFVKKIYDSSIYIQKDLVIWSFIFNFFQTQQIIINNYSLFYLNETLQIFISYYLSIEHYYNQKIKTLLKKRKLSYNKQINYFLEPFFVSLQDFSRKKTSLFFLVFQKLNSTLKVFMTTKIKHLLKKNLVNLRKFKQISLFENSVNLLIIIVSTKKSSNILAKYIAINVENLKQHNFFLWFISKVLTLFIQNPMSKIKKIKINIKGRLNSNPRANIKQIEINKNTALLTLPFKLNYAKKTAFNQNGTIGIKIWTYDL